MLVRRGAVTLAPGRMRIRDGGWSSIWSCRKTVASRRGVPTARASKREKTTPRRTGTRAKRTREALGAHEVWTRKQAGVRAHGTLTLDGGSPRAIEALAVIDDTAGYHARAHRVVVERRGGHGRGRRGARVEPRGTASTIRRPGSERAVWVDGVPCETPPVRFAADLSEIVAAATTVRG